MIHEKTEVLDSFLVIPVSAFEISETEKRRQESRKICKESNGQHAGILIFEWKIIVQLTSRRIGHPENSGVYECLSLFKVSYFC